MDDMKHIPVDEFLKGIDRHLPASEKVEMVLEWLPTARTSKDIETIEKWLRKNISKPVLNAAAIFLDPTDLQLDGVDRFFVFGSKGVAEIEHPLGKEGFYYGDLAVNANGGVVHAYGEVMVVAKDTTIEACHNSHVSMLGGCSAVLHDQAHGASCGMDKVELRDFAQCVSTKRGVEYVPSEFQLHDSAWLEVREGNPLVEAHGHNVIQVEKGANPVISDHAGSIVLSYNPDLSIDNDRSVVVTNPYMILSSMQERQNVLADAWLEQEKPAIPQTLTLPEAKQVFGTKARYLEGCTAELLDRIEQASTKVELLEAILPLMDQYLYAGLNKLTLLSAFDQDTLSDHGIYLGDAQVDLSVAPRDYFVLNDQMVFQKKEDEHRGHFHGYAVGVLEGGDHVIDANAIGLAFGDSRLRCTREGSAYLTDQAHAVATDWAKVVATKDSELLAEGNTRVFGQDKAHVVGRDNTIAYMMGASSGEFQDKVSVIWRSQGECYCGKETGVYLIEGEGRPVSHEKGTYQTAIQPSSVSRMWEQLCNYQKHCVSMKR